VDMHRETVEKEVLAICEKVMEKVNRNLQVRHGN